jgi:NADH:ubiquinone oxidoreductase subunit D
LFIIYQIISYLPTGFIKTNKISLNRSLIKHSIQSTISHFKFFSNRFLIKNNLVYKSVEAPKREFGVFLVSNSTNRPYRCKVRAPRFFHLQAVSIISKNFLIADLVVIIRTLDIVFGEVDR